MVRCHCYYLCTTKLPTDRRSSSSFELSSWLPGLDLEPLCRSESRCVSAGRRTSHQRPAERTDHARARGRGLACVPHENDALDAFCDPASPAQLSDAMTFSLHLLLVLVLVGRGEGFLRGWEEKECEREGRAAEKALQAVSI